MACSLSIKSASHHLTYFRFSELESILRAYLLPQNITSQNGNMSFVQNVFVKTEYVVARKWQRARVCTSVWRRASWIRV